MKVEIYSKTACPYCNRAKDYLRRNGIAYEEINYDDNTARQEMYDKLGLVGTQRTVPQIFVVDGSSRERIGGYNDLIHSDLLSRREAGTFTAEF